MRSQIAIEKIVENRSEIWFQEEKCLIVGKRLLVERNPSDSSHATFSSNLRSHRILLTH